jgi:hypothetical protein
VALAVLVQKMVYNFRSVEPSRFDMKCIKGELDGI